MTCLGGVDVYSESRKRDVVIFTKAVLTNQVARYFPKLYVKMTKQTGRGENEGTPDETAQYFLTCVEDYRKQLGLTALRFRSFLAGKDILEYGPGDTLGVAVILFAYGASSVHCVDRFPLSAASPHSLNVYRSLLAQFEAKDRARAASLFKTAGDPASGFSETGVRYSITPHGLSGESNKYDIIISRAVLEHVNDLDGTFGDVARALKRGGTSLHKVDLSSHGLDRNHPFDFLTWPEWAYRLMYSHKGLPNRWRVNHYQKAAIRAGLSASGIQPTDTIDAKVVSRIADALPPRLADTPREVLGWRGFWMTLEHEAARQKSPLKKASDFVLEA